MENNKDLNAADEEFQEIEQQIPEEEIPEEPEQEGADQAADADPEPAGNEPVFCSKCGAEMPAGSLFCSKCGQKIISAEEGELANKISQFNAGIDKSAKIKKLLPVIIAAAVIIVIGIVLLSGGGGGGKDFRKLYADIADKSWCTIASDGSYMKIDTNPYDVDDYTIYEAYLKIKQINKDLGFSAVVTDDMASTRAVDGRQSAESQKATVTWRYHPDNGLEVTYSWK